MSNSEDYKSYLFIANYFYAGDMFKAFMNLSALAKMTGQDLPKSWHAFQGSVKSFQIQFEYLKNNYITKEEFEKRFRYKTSQTAKSNFNCIMHFIKISS